MAKHEHKSTGTPATVALHESGVRFVMHPYAHDPRAKHFGEETADVLGVDPSRVFKTLITELTGGPEPLVTSVVPASARLDLKAIASAAGAKKATLADPELAQRITGFVRGGISPLGQKRQTPVFIDSSARDSDTIFVSGGRRGLSIEIAPDDLLAATGGQFVPISR